MSLVAYTASDDSDQSETEESNDVVETTQAAETAPIASVAALPPKVDDFVHDASDGRISDSDSEADVQDSTDVPNRHDAENQDVLSLLKGLPEPRNINVESNREPETKDTREGNEDELEEEVKPKMAQIKDAPKPPPKKNKVKITIPALNDDEEEQVRKKPKLAPSSGKSGLFSLLPAPMHMSVKVTNRTLIPHTLTKKPAQSTEKNSKETSKPVPQSQKTVSKNKIQGIAGYGSDSEESDGEDESGNFFSLGNPSNSVKLDIAQDLPKPASSGLKFSKMELPPPKISLTENKDNSSELSSSSDANNTTELINEPNATTDNPTSDIMTFDSTSPNQDAPLSFKMSSSNLNAPLSFKSGNWNTMKGSGYGGWYGTRGSHSSVTADYSHYQESEMEADNNPEYEEMESGSPTETAGGDDLKDFTHDEEFLKMQGKKHRGKEDINIVDVNADDFISPVELTKHLSEETEQRSHRKKDGPTSQQKRKHQITYLAFQAKEKELELKNAWSQNRMTKRQTQAKYGF